MKPSELLIKNCHLCQSAHSTFPNINVIGNILDQMAEDIKAIKYELAYPGTIKIVGREWDNEPKRN